MIDKIFDFCVYLLIETGKLTHMSYKAVNVWIFCIIWPLLTLALIFIIIKQAVKIKNLKKLLDGKKQ